MSNLLLILFFCFLPGTALAQGLAPGPEWYERIGGILAIPVTIFGIPLTWVTIRKTNLEARKTRLEILEKEKLLSQSAVPSEEVEHEVLRPILRESILGTVIFRFVLLFLVIQFWQIVQGLWSFFLSIIIVVFQTQEWFFDLFSDDYLLVQEAILALQALPQIVLWVFIVALGWPLLKDVNRYIRIIGRPDST